MDICAERLLSAKITLGMIDKTDTDAIDAILGSDFARYVQMGNSISKSSYGSDVILEYLRSIGHSVDNEEDAIHTIIASLAQSVLSGRLSPIEGARQIWGVILDRQFALRATCLGFISLAGDFEEMPSDRLSIENDIRELSRNYLSYYSPPLPKMCAR